MWLLGNDLHGDGVPANELLLEVGGVAQERWGRGAEAEAGVFHDGLLVADGIDEGGVVGDLFGVAGGRAEAPGGRGAHGVGAGLLIGVLLLVGLEEIVLDVLGEGFEVVAGAGFARNAGDGEAISDIEGDVAFGAGEAEELAAAGAGFKVHAEGDLVCGVLVGLGVVVKADHEIGHIAAVVPEVGAAGGKDAFGAHGVHDVVDAGEEVDEEVARDAGAVVLIVAPTEEADGLKGALGRGADELVPIDGAGRGVVGDDVLPGTEGGVAIIEGFDHSDLSDLAFLDDFAQAGVEDVANALGADLEDLAGFLFGGDDAVAVFRTLHHGLLAVDVFAGEQGFAGLLGVPMVGGGNNDGVDIGAGEDLAVVAGDGELFAEDFAGALETTLIDVGGSDEFDAGNRSGGLGVTEAHVANADATEADFIVRGNLRLRLSDSGGAGHQGAGFQKFSSCRHRLDSGYVNYTQRSIVYGGIAVCCERGAAAKDRSFDVFVLALQG